MYDALGSIPKGVNIVIFIWAAVGLVMMLRDPKFRKERFFFLSLAVVGFMALWRILIGIDTSRYAAGLILPFTVSAAYLLYVARKKRHLPVRLVLCVALICSGFIIPKMILDSVFRNYSSDVMSEMFRDLDRTHNDYAFLVPRKDLSRILFSSRLDRKLKAITMAEGRDIERDVVCKYVTNYKRAYPDTVLNIESRTLKDNKTDDKTKEKMEKVLDILRPKQIASIVDDARKEKKQMVFILSTGNQSGPVSENRIPPYRPNLLDNGDLEEQDSPEESGTKMNAHLGDLIADGGAALAAAGPPRNAFFSVEATPETIPEFRIQNDDAIDGEHSVRIRAGEVAAYMMFDKRFSNGQYDYSMLIKGETDTNVAIICEINREDGGSKIRRIALFTIPDRRLFQISTHFSMEDLNGGDDFRIGVSVEKGEAFFDNFSLTPADSGVPGATSSGTN